MKPELTVLTPKDAPKPEGQEDLVPAQSEMPFAVVDGEPVTELPQDLYIPPYALQVFLEAFEGPLDLLLYLIRRQNLDILDIPIAEITRQYVEYIELMKEMQLELAGEYLLMAAMLAEIKSRMLLPVHEGDEEDEDPRSEITKPLLEYLEMKAAADHLANRNLLGDKTFVRTHTKQPYLDEHVVDFSLTVPKDLKIREEDGQVWGKWCLRKAFEPFLPPEFIWQAKRPLEKGSGMTNLRIIIAERITDSEFAEKQKHYPVKFLCKEHLYFYELYREEVGDIPPPREGDDRCPGCGGGLPRRKKHCSICGTVL